MYIVRIELFESSKHACFSDCAPIHTLIGMPKKSIQEALESINGKELFETYLEGDKKFMESIKTIEVSD